MIDYSIEAFQYKYIEEVIQIWNESLIYDLMTKERFLDEILLDPNFSSEMFVLAISDKKVIGFAYGIKRKVPYFTKGLEPERAWVYAIAVDKKYRRNGIGSNLIKRLEKIFADLGSKRITLNAYSPTYLTPGVDLKYEGAEAFFKEMKYDFSNSRTVSMCNNLFNFVLETDEIEKINILEKEGYCFRQYKQSDTLDLINFADKEFGGGWAQNVMTVIKQGDPSNSIVIAINNDEIVGFCLRGIDGKESRFGPIGIAESQRGKGLGGILLQLMLELMKKNKTYYTYFLWTSGSNISFYEKYGFEVYREYRLGGKDYE